MAVLQMEVLVIELSQVIGTNSGNEHPKLQNNSKTNFQSILDKKRKVNLYELLDRYTKSLEIFLVESAASTKREVFGYGLQSQLCLEC